MLQKLDDKDYFELSGVSNSYINAFLKCPAAVNIRTATTPQMTLGTLVHSMVLDGEKATLKRFAVVPECDRRTKEGKALYAEFEGKCKGRELVSANDLANASAILKSIMDHPQYKLLYEVDTEIAVTWEDQITGLPCKAKVDAFNGQVLVDLKTMSDGAAHPDKVLRKILDMGYHRQMAFYYDGIRRNGICPEKIIIVAADTSAPYSVGFYELNEDLLEYGRKQYRAALNQIAQAKETNSFPSYTSPEVVTLTLPKWLQESTTISQKG